jgi:hypothetical protein
MFVRSDARACASTHGAVAMCRRAVGSIAQHHCCNRTSPAARQHWRVMNQNGWYTRRACSSRATRRHDASSGWRPCAQRQTRSDPRRRPRASASVASITRPTRDRVGIMHHVHPGSTRNSVERRFPPFRSLEPSFSSTNRTSCFTVSSKLPIGVFSFQSTRPTLFPFAKLTVPFYIRRSTLLPFAVDRVYRLLAS